MRKAMKIGRKFSMKGVLFIAALMVLCVLSGIRAKEIQAIQEHYAEILDVEDIHIDQLDDNGTTVVYDDDREYVLLVNAGVNGEYETIKKRLADRGISTITYLLTGNGEEYVDGVTKLLADDEIEVDVIYRTAGDGSEASIAITKAIAESEVDSNNIFNAEIGDRLWLAATDTRIISVTDGIAVKVKYGETNCLIAGDSRLASHMDLQADVLFASNESKVFGSVWSLREIHPESVVLACSKDTDTAKLEKKIGKIKVGEEKTLKPDCYKTAGAGVCVTTNGSGYEISYR